MNNYYLSVYCQTYNFEEYVKDTLQGFVNQITNFPFKVFVYDDASTDSTPDIIKQYKADYPDLFDIYLSKKNMYHEPNRNEYLCALMKEHMEGAYVACCEGDDYWIDPYKLQKQVDFMNDNPECTLCVHASHWINYATNEEYDFHPYEKSRFLTPEEVILQTNGNPSTASYMYRGEDLVLGDFFQRHQVGDYTRQLYELSKGKVYYMDEVMSVYNYFHPGSWSSRYGRDNTYAMKHNFDMQVFLEDYDKYTDYRFHSAVEKRIFRYLYDAVLLDDNTSYDTYDKLLKEAEYVSDHNYKKYKRFRDRIGAIVRGTYEFDNQEQAILQRCEKIVIYGCGDYSRFFRNCLEHKNLPVDGYVISDDQRCAKDYEGKPVWRLREYPFDIDKTVFIIGVGYKLEPYISKALEDYGIKNVIRSFWIREEDINND